MLVVECSKVRHFVKLGSFSVFLSETHECEATFAHLCTEWIDRMLLPNLTLAKPWIGAASLRLINNGDDFILLQSFQDLIYGQRHNITAHNKPQAIMEKLLLNTFWRIIS